MDTGLWPVRKRLDPQSWLTNFSENERPFAYNLLNVFLYYNEDLVDALLIGAFQRVSAHVVGSATTLADARTRWRTFLSSVLVTQVQGEDPNPADSGYAFARKARQVLRIDEAQIAEPRHALSDVSIRFDTPVLLVDDFVGSGNQLVETWHRRQGAEGLGSLAAAAEAGVSIFYVPLVATSLGIARLRRECSNLKVFPAHLLDERYSLIAPNSILWPESLKPHAQAFLLDASDRAGIVDGYEYGWKGFHDLALAVAFAHSVPDATLPLFFWDRNGWKPLLVKA